MKQDDLWHSFLMTGRVEDYLRYRGIDLYALRQEPKKETKHHAADNRRSHHPGK